MSAKTLLGSQEPSDTQPGFAVYEDLFDDREYGNLGPLYLQLMGVPVELVHNPHESHLTVTLTRECAYSLGLVLISNGPLKPPAGARERLKRLLTVIDATTQLLGSREAAMEWDHTPNFPLGGVVPLDLLITESGMNLVLDQIQQQEGSAPL